MAQMPLTYIKEEVYGMIKELSHDKVRPMKVPSGSVYMALMSIVGITLPEYECIISELKAEGRITSVGHLLEAV
jgi:hypothetical protein